MTPPEPLGHAFGLEVAAEFPLPGLGRSARHPQRRVTCRAASAVEIGASWHEDGSRSAVELRYPDGRPFLEIRAHDEAGYRVHAPRYGLHLVSTDGTQVTSALPRNNPLGAQRLLFAQTLPLAAALQGLEPLHASAVALDGNALAFTAPSGTGKSSLAAHLVAAGAGFLTDDVLALERGDDGVVAHPGAARLSLAPAELRAATRAGRARLGGRVGRGDGKVVLEPPPGAPARLAALYRLRRGGSTARVCEHDPPEPLPILASAFLPYLRTPDRLRNQLAVCEAVVETVRSFELVLPPTLGARDAAELVLAHAAGTALR
jgi:hypothetical protein